MGMVRWIWHVAYCMAGLIIVGAVLLVRWLWDHGRPGSGPGDAPLDILKRRYARGEITKEEFDRVKQDLV